MVSRGSAKAFECKWLVARQELLAKEKELTRRRDALNAERRRLPMVRIEKDYFLEGPNGKASLLDLFEGRRQLIVYHFMFDPITDEGCDGCSIMVDNMGHPAHLHARDTSRVLVSRAPLAKIEPFKKRMGWTILWYSSFGSDFNYDFGVTTDEGGGITTGTNRTGRRMNICKGSPHAWGSMTKPKRR